MTVRAVYLSRPARVRFASSLPMGEKTGGAAGSMNLAPHADHQHPRMTSATIGVLGANGEATMTFTRTFASEPVPVVTLIESGDGQPVLFKIKSWTRSGPNNTGDYTGCIVKGQRSQLLPSVILNLGALLSFNLFGGSAAGARFGLTVLPQSTPST